MGAKRKSGKRARKTASNHAQFVLEYLANGRNASAAYRKIHPRASERTASVGGAQLIANHSVQRLLAEREKELSDKTGLTAEWVLERLRIVAERCLQSEPVLDKKGEQIFVETPEGELVPAYTFQPVGANKALELIGKHVGIFEKDNKQKSDAVADLLAAVSQRGGKIPLKE